MKIYLLLSLAVLLLFSLTLAGCETTPEGGSSLPWTQPEPWENQMNIGPEY